MVRLFADINDSDVYFLKFSQANCDLNTVQSLTEDTFYPFVLALHGYMKYRYSYGSDPIFVIRLITFASTLE